jgi:hypothetical protein
MSQQGYMMYYSWQLLVKTASSKIIPLTTQHFILEVVQQGRDGEINPPTTSNS